MAKKEEVKVKVFVEETHKRSVLKVFLFETECVVSSAIFFGLFSGMWSISLKAGVCIELFDIITLYLFERVWNKFQWGRKVYKAKVLEDVHK